MKIKFKLITSILLGALFLFSACEERELAYETFDPTTAEGDQVVLVGSSSKTVVVDAAQESYDFEISAKLQGPVSSSDISVPFVVDSTTLSDAAYDIAASDLLIEGGKTSGTLSVTLYPDEMFPGEIFKLYYSLGTPSAGEVHEMGATGEITTYNPGFMGPWVGSYTVDAASYGSPGDWDEVWQVTTELNPDDPLNSILMNGIGGGDAPVAAFIDPDAGTITIPAGQHCGDAYGYGPIGVVYATPEFEFDGSADLTGTADPETGTIQVDNWGMLILEGDYAGSAWDVFNTTFVKDSKKSAATYIPKHKKPRMK